MSKINILDSSIFNRISAGEVVEKPASVVKELVENSIDSGATSITIEIVEAGIKEIKITDNGCGIEFDDLQSAFLPHATSKIKEIDDLDGISTLGFRGEALASIGSVSMVTLQSKTKDCEFGGKIEVEGGKINKPVECACVDGTTISVKNLFFNVPARAKFLKTNKTEEASITTFVTRLILANPKISFKYVADGKIVYQTTGKDLHEAIYTIYGKEAINNIIPLNYKTGNVSVDGYICKPSFCKPNRTYQTLMVNGRYVVNQLISTAIFNAYENFVMKGRFPFFVLNIQVPFEDVDVNVHPNKLEIKFKPSLNMFGIVNNAVANELLQLNNVFEGEINSITDDVVKTESNVEFAKIIGGHSFSTLEKSEKNEICDIEPVKTATIFSSQTTNFSPQTSMKTFHSDNDNIYYNLFKRVNSKDIVQEDILLNKDENNETNISYASRIVGTLFNTYILLEKDDELYLIDQHAGHERVLFDNYKKQFEEKTLVRQELLVPYIFNVNHEEADLLLSELETINSLGFDIEPFGNNTFKITNVPLILQSINLKDFIEDSLKNINKVSKTNEVIKDFIATKACKAAVKGGQQLSDNEINYLLNKIYEEKTTLLCPHGRPVCVKMTKDQIEKMFKRKV